MTQLTGQPEAALLADAPPRAERSLAADLAQLMKLRITAMVALTAYVGFEIGRASPAGAGDAAAWAGAAGWPALAATLVGTSLACMGASALNQLLERDLDALMRRTRNRPLPAGRLSARTAAALGVGLSLAGVALLALAVNPLTALLAAFTVMTYVLLYTPMKRVSSACTIVGAVPGAMPPVMGFAAATGTLGPEAWAMFAIMFLWQLPHFLAIAWLYRDDYARAGMPMLPVVDGDGGATRRQILVGCLTLLPVGLTPTVLGMSGPVYFWGALACGGAFLALGAALVVVRTRALARALFFASLIYLPAVFALMLFDRA